MNKMAFHILYDYGVLPVTVAASFTSMLRHNTENEDPQVDRHRSVVPVKCIATIRAV
jgi:hypothetical protein